jgi:3-deoxy-D-arabino-heptulosonate 7-phosphate (DAHP) synthase
MLEIHPQPAKALSDAAQTLNFEEFSALIGKLRQHYTQVMQRDLDLGVTSTATL